MSQIRVTAAQAKELIAQGRVKPPAELLHPERSSPKRPRRSKAEWIAKFGEVPEPAPASEAEKQIQRALFERHDAVKLTIRFPLPPSTNHYWRSWYQPKLGRVLTHVSTEGQAYQEAVRRVWRDANKGWTPEPLTGRLRLLVTVVFPRNDTPDLDNRIKSLQDAMAESGIYGNDNQIDDLRAIRGPVAKPGWVDVVIETITETPSEERA